MNKILYFDVHVSPDHPYSLYTSLDSVASLKTESFKSEVLESLVYFTNALKQITSKPGVLRPAFDLEQIVVLQKKTLHEARRSYYSSLREENKNIPRFLFSARARLAKSQNFSILLQHSILQGIGSLYLTFTLR